MSAKNIDLSDNRFDALRLIFATFVFIYHIVALASLNIGGAVEVTTSHLADIGVKGFFVISGALVYGSLERSKALKTYASKRVRRLFPAYATIIFIPTIAALIINMADGAIAQNFAAISQYFLANIIFLNFLQPELPGFFADNRFAAINGALWTIKIEVMFYAALPIIGLIIKFLGKHRILYLLIFFYIAGECWRLFFVAYASDGGGNFAMQIARQLPGQMAYFASGMGVWIYREKLASRMHEIGALGILLFALSWAPYLDVLRPAALAAFVYFLAWTPGPKFNVTKWGDLSYGVYITHFPIIQILVALALVFQAVLRPRLQLELLLHWRLCLAPLEVIDVAVCR